MSESVSAQKIPRRIRVRRILSSRYAQGARPSEWDLRVEGVDRILSYEGEEISLLSGAMQSPPQPGWEILLRSGSAAEEYCWTLYGMARG